jgi:hypothetical protein
LRDSVAAIGALAVLRDASLDRRLTLDGGLAKVRAAVKLINYEDVPAMCDQLLAEVELKEVIFEVRKNGRPWVRIEPVDDATKAGLPSSGQEYHRVHQVESIQK